MTAGKCKPDRVWSLDPDHEIVFKQSWALVLKHWGYDLDHLTFEDIEEPSNFVASKSKNALPNVSSVFDFSLAPRATERTTSTFNTLCGSNSFEKGIFDTTAQPVTKHVFDLLAKFNSPLLHQAICNTMRNDSPDNNFLRFVRARKFQLLPSVEMAAKCLEWRTQEHRVDEWLLAGDVTFAETHPGIVNSLKLEKVYFRGRDREGGPIVVIKVKKHFGHDCPEVEFERFICLVIEWVRLALKDYELGNDGANVLFDMSGFGLLNADLASVKFLATAFEANYPESLSAIWIHNAPWIFNAVWKIIRVWLDPVVASKVHFTYTAADLEKFVDRKFIPKDLGGDDEYVPVYVPPTSESSGKLAKDEKYEKWVQQRRDYCYVFIETPLAWIKAKTVEESTKLLDYKIQIGAELAKNYILLDPYIRERGPFDRDGQLGAITL